MKKPALSLIKLLSLLMVMLIFCINISLYFLLFRPFISGKIKSYEEDKINIYTRAVIENLESSIDRITKNLSSQGKQFGIKRDLEKCRKKLSDFEKFNSGFYNMVLVLGDGTIIATSSDQADISLFVNSDLLNIPIKYQTLFFDPQPVNLDNGTTTFAVSTPTADPGMVLMALIKPEMINSLLINSINDPLSFNWNIMLVSNTGNLLYHSHIDIEGLSVDEQDFADHAAVENTLSGNWGLQKIKIESVEWYVSSQFTRLTDWALIVMVPGRELKQNVTSLIIPQTIFVTVFFLIFFMLLMLVINWLIRPIEKITRALINFGENRDSTLLPIKGPGEIGKAYKAFNQMIKERRDLEHEVLTSGEIERKRIGMDLHDDLGQILTGIAFQNMLVLEEAGPDMVEVAKLAGETAEMISTAIQKTRHIARGLYPLPMIEMGFEFAIRELADKTETIYEIECRVSIAVDFSEPEDATAIQCYHIIQEAVHNAVKHGNPTLIEIMISEQGGSVTIMIKDNGTGFDNITNKGSGLRFMRYRAQSINADFTIKSGTKGTVVTFTINNEEHTDGHDQKSDDN